MRSPHGWATVHGVSHAVVPRDWPVGWVWQYCGTSGEGVDVTAEPDGRLCAECADRLVEAEKRRAGRCQR